MLAVLGYSTADVEQAKQLLAWCAELDGCQQEHRLLVVASSRVAPDDNAGIMRLGKQAFEDFAAIQVLPELDMDGWPHGSVALIRTAMGWMRGKPHIPWLWWEPDAIPMKPGWLTAIETEYRHCGKPFMGCVWDIPSRHLNAVAVWPGDYWKYNPQLKALRHDKPIDFQGEKITLRHAFNTPLIQRVLREPRRGGEYTFPDHESLGVVDQRAVLFHGCKDGTLIQRLRERGNQKIERPQDTSIGGGVLKMAVGAITSVIERFRPKLPLRDVTLVCVDTQRPDLAMRAIMACKSKCNFGGIKFFTNDHRYPNTIPCPHIANLSVYSEFIMKEVWKHVHTSHMLIVQWDGYILDAEQWTPDFLKWDYVGAPSDIANNRIRITGNGGFSLRSTRLMEAVAKLPLLVGPEDQVICLRHRKTLESQGFRFAPENLATHFSCEIWPFGNHFGFHSFQTAIPKSLPRPIVFHHTGDWGDIIYGLASMAAYRECVLFISPVCNTPMYPRQKPNSDSVAIIEPLLRLQPYLWQTKWATGIPASTDIDLNQFRVNYKTGTNSLMNKQLVVANAEWPEDKPWLTVDFPVSIPDRPIVVNASSRHRNNDFPWDGLVKRHGHQMVFVGLKGEHEDFVYRFGDVPHIQTANLLEVARVIAGARVFIGNQSCPMAIALGLGQNVIQEVFTTDANCKLNRHNAIYPSNSSVEIPKQWLQY